MAKPFVILELDRPRKLRFGNNALIMIEQLTGKDITKAENLMSLNFTDTMKFIYAGLYFDDKTLTLEQLGDLIDEYSDLETIGEKLNEAIEAMNGNKKKN